MRVFYTTRKHQKTFGFLMFSGVIERKLVLDGLKYISKIKFYNLVKL